MEHYFKGKNVEYEEVLDPELAKVLPVAPQEVTWIRVKPGSKVHNMIGPAGTGINEKGVIVISGSGAAVTKVVSCAEVIKRRCKVAHQSSKLCSKIVEEHWEPTRDDLEPLKVTREIPNLQIVLSKGAFEGSHLQSKTSLESFLGISISTGGTGQSKHNNRRSNSSKKSQNSSRGNNNNGNNANNNESAAKELGLENHRKKRQKTNNKNSNNQRGSTNERQGIDSSTTNEKPQKAGGSVNKSKDQTSTGLENNGQQQQQQTGSNQTQQNQKGQKKRLSNPPKTGSNGGGGDDGEQRNNN